VARRRPLFLHLSCYLFSLCLALYYDDFAERQMDGLIERIVLRVDIYGHTRVAETHNAKATPRLTWNPAASRTG